MLQWWWRWCVASWYNVHLDAHSRLCPTHPTVCCLCHEVVCASSHTHKNSRTYTASLSLYHIICVWCHTRNCLGCKCHTYDCSASLARDVDFTEFIQQVLLELWQCMYNVNICILCSRRVVWHQQSLCFTATTSIKKYQLSQSNAC